MRTPRHSLLPSSLLAIVTTALLPAQGQGKLRARNFHVDDYRTVVRVDMKAFRETGVWEELRVGGAVAVAHLFVEEMGFGPDELDVVTMTRRLPQPATAGGERESVGVVVFEGNQPLQAVETFRPGRYTVERVGSYDLYLDTWTGDAATTPDDKLLVTGGEQLLRDVLEGRPRSGLPSADVMAFTAGKSGTLIDVVVDLGQEPGLEAELVSLLSEAEAGVTWPADDRPSMIGVRLAAIGDEDDRHLQLEVVVRHGTAGAGIAVTERSVDAGVEALKRLKEARLFRPLLKSIERERRGTDAIWRVDLGRARAFGGSLVTLAPLVVVGYQAWNMAMKMQGGGGPALQVVDEAEAVAEPPPPPDAGGGDC